MKKFQLSFLCVCLSIVLFAQPEKKDELIKKNWNFGALPTITFDTDLGFQYGALVNLYNYGDGSRFPKYNHSLYFEVSRFTKGSGINRFYYDSDQLIKGLQTSVDLSYLSDQGYDFYGFNGYDAVYQSDWIDSDNTADYKTRMFYKYDRKLFRFKVDLQGKLSGDHIRWIGGFNLQNFAISSVNLDKLNKGKSGSDVLPPVDGLFELYQQWGIIPEKEANGGFVPALKGGIVYDSRDNRPNPMKGIWTEAVLEGAPEFLGAESSFAKLSLIHRQYFTLVPKNLSFVYRLAYQTTVAGHTPFYYQSQVITSVLTGALSEGLGGGKTMRGILRNRVVGDGFFYGNLEMRWKVVRFNWINNNFYIGLNAFTDFGKVTEKIDVKSIIAPMSSVPQPDYFNWDAEKFHYSYGAGLRVVMNENFVIAADYGMTPNEQDGTSGIYIGLNYLF
ncbi:MAG TPA: BamA/TamA family outer membrane protein [Prolixibacteraceae bacterium]|nr:BamA/TamA family outer membrane protein [Prolixibacteraceae bacterium]